MKKFLTIGRDTQCDICINDSTDVVSRNHAILEIGSNGKYFITDQSRNGTYVNGMRISPNEKVPVTRNDVVSLAHVRELDWSLVPKNNTVVLWAAIACGVVAVVAVVALLLHFGVFSGTDSNKGALNLGGGGSAVEQPGGGGAVVETPDNGDNAEDPDNQAQEETKPADEKENPKPDKKKPADGNKKTDDGKKDDSAVVDAIY